ncbi:MAG: patatin family protein [Gammaproteobacteria bacterium]|nr:patatin family protein [Gammaproteobacteria bacterium]
MSENRKKIRRIINGEETLPVGDALHSLVEKLKDDLDFGVARKLLNYADSKFPDNIKIIQQCALCTYKDEELPPHTRFDEALTLLEKIGLRDSEKAVADGRIKSSTIPETLGLGGAIYKRKWEYGGLLEHLQQALMFYLAAWNFDPKVDGGWGGVNAAYVLDLLAARAGIVAARSGIISTNSSDVIELRQKADTLRQQMRDILVTVASEYPEYNKKYWYLVTMAEIYFGLNEHREAGDWLTKAAECKADDRKAAEWKLQTTFKQFVSLARLQGYLPPIEGQQMVEWAAPWQALHKLLGDETETALSCYRGKVGLALSGGGFRASLYHLGVLARLAEMDVLRSVEVLSTVSGGSIVGAHYYLEIQDLLQNTPDNQLDRDTYTRLIKERLIPRFLAGVQCNLRTRTLANFWANLRMIYSKEYSRSHRIGELYERELYNHIGETPKHNRSRTLPELLVGPAPQHDSKKFKPKYHNWRRRAKVPVLLLNTTSLNSGHSWHFTACWMGEPPGNIGPEIDVNQRYRRLWYDQAFKNDHKNYRLGYAVAASACVPGLFEPLALDDLYPDHTVRLVDGGVHDNQGVQGLLEEGCTLVLCSDASGQMDDMKKPSNGIIGVSLRANSILMDRVRESGYQQLSARVESQSLQGLFFIHMKKELETMPVDWINCDDPTMPVSNKSSMTSYSIDKDIQHKLAALRTDLDSFSDVEAYSLMLSGYLMTERHFKELNVQHQYDKQPGSWGNFNANAPRGEWEFLKLESILKEPENSQGCPSPGFREATGRWVCSFLQDMASSRMAEGYHNNQCDLFSGFWNMVCD